MSILKNLATDASIADERDSVGSGGPLDSGLYPATITLAYITKAASEALGLVIHAKTDAGRDIRQTLWMTSGKAKGCKNYYEKDGKKTYLPGFLAANAIALLTVGKEISELDTETKVVQIYNKDAKAEVPTKVECLVDLLGQQVIFGLIKNVVDKTAKNEATGTYDPTGETREENEIDKIFRASDSKTTAEIRAQAEEAVFVHTWEKKWAGQVRNKAKGAAAGAGVVGAPRGAAANAATAKPTKSLFAA
jgi:hypothetical protein